MNLNINVYVKKHNFVYIFSKNDLKGSFKYFFN
jgi:hypothetical protein